MFEDKISHLAQVVVPYLSERVKVLAEHGFTEEECVCLADCLRELTNSIICENGLWQKDAKKIEILQQKRKEIMESSLGTVDKIYWLLEYCKRYGTLPFAGLARAGFIAVEFLRSMVATGIMTEEERSVYMNGLSTIGKNMSRDLTELSPTAFLKRYGHLRPDTYDICSPRYDQGSELYFNFTGQQDSTDEEAPSFRLSLGSTNISGICLKRTVWRLMY